MTSANELDALAKAFEKELYDDYRFLARTKRYRAADYQDMIKQHTGVGAARLLLRDANASDGFTRLREIGMLAHSLEATALRPKYGSLFSPDELRTARSRLEAHGFDVDRFLKGLH